MTQSTFVWSAELYRSLRKGGITIRKTVDCLMASLCLEHNARLLHHDRDSNFIAEHYPLQIA